MCTYTVYVYHNQKLTNRISGGLFALLVLAVVPGDCSMSSFTLYCLPIWTYQYTSHHAKTTIACSKT